MSKIGGPGTRLAEGSAQSVNDARSPSVDVTPLHLRGNECEADAGRAVSEGDLIAGAIVPERVWSQVASSGRVQLETSAPARPRLRHPHKGLATRALLTSPHDNRLVEQANP